MAAGHYSSQEVGANLGPPCERVWGLHNPNFTPLGTKCSPIAAFRRIPISQHTSESRPLISEIRRLEQEQEQLRDSHVRLLIAFGISAVRIQSAYPEQCISSYTNTNAAMSALLTVERVPNRFVPNGVSPKQEH